MLTILWYQLVVSVTGFVSRKYGQLKIRHRDSKGHYKESIKKDTPFSYIKNPSCVVFMQKGKPDREGVDGFIYSFEVYMNGPKDVSCVMT